MAQGDSINIWRDQNLPGLEVKRAVKSTHVYPNHSHDYYTIGVMEEGGSYCHLNSFVAPGTLSLINPGQVHNGVAPKGVLPTYTMFYMDTDWIRQAALETGASDYDLPEFTELVVADKELHAAYLKFAQVVAWGSERLACESAMVSVFSKTLLRYGGYRSCEPGDNGEPRAVRLAKEYLNDNLGTNVSLDELASITGLSRYHFLRVFKKATNLSPHAFHVQQRISYARNLLLQGRTIADTALDAGFSDQSHFTNKFKQMIGVTPGRYMAG